MVKSAVCPNAEIVRAATKLAVTIKEGRKDFIWEDSSLEKENLTPKYNKPFRRIGGAIRFPQSSGCYAFVGYGKYWERDSDGSDDDGGESTD